MYNISMQLLKVFFFFFFFFFLSQKCSSVAAKDQYFPEYCCASFTECCDLITTFTNPVKVSMNQ